MNFPEPASPVRRDPIVDATQWVVRLAVRALAVIMAFVVFWGVLDVVWIIYDRMTTRPYFLLDVTNILDTFGVFMAVLIAIEIFINITMYLREDVIHVKIVMATALIAIARKVIIIDVKETTAMMLLGTAAVVLATSLGYYLVVVRDTPRSRNAAAPSTED